MKNPAPYIREALVALLHNQISYKGSAVPCYSGDAENVAYQILIRDQTGRGANDRNSINTEYEQLIEVISQGTVNTYRHVDEIGEDVLQLLFPDPVHAGIPQSGQFQYLKWKLVSQSYLSEESLEKSFINRLIIRIAFLTVEK